MRNPIVRIATLCLLLLLMYHFSCDEVCHMKKLNNKNIQEMITLSGQIADTQALLSGLQAEYKDVAKRVEHGSGLISMYAPITGGVVYAGRDEVKTTRDEGEMMIGETQTGEVKTFKRRVNSHGRSKALNELCYDDCTFTGVLLRYGLPTQPFIDNEIKHKVKKELAVCIARADSHLGRALKSKNNIGNVGNNDRGQIINYSTIEDGIEAMYKVLNNRYLGHKQTVGSLSVGGGGTRPYYATSPENRNNNVLNCLNTILDAGITEERNFRI